MFGYRAANQLGGWGAARLEFFVLFLVFTNLVVDGEGAGGVEASNTLVRLGSRLFFLFLLGLVC